MTPSLSKKSPLQNEGEGQRKNVAVMGLNVAKFILSVAIVSETKLLFERNYENSKRGRKKIIQLCLHYHVISVGCESTSQYHLKMGFTLTAAQISVLVANPNQTKTTEGKKTDKLDARRIAVAHHDGRLWSR